MPERSRDWWKSSVAQEILAGAAADALPRMEHNAKRADLLQVAEH